MDIKKINFKQPKYLLPAIIYLPLLFVGYFIIDMFNVEVSDATNKKLKTTDYLSSELPEAYTDSILGDKMTNTENQFGRISDLSGVQNVENDNDSVNQKKDFESKYSEDEARKVRMQQAEEKRKLAEMQERVRANRSDANKDDFVDPLKDSEIASAQRRRRQRSWEEMNKTLSGSDSYMASNDESVSEGGPHENGNTASGTPSTGSTASYNSHSDNASYDNSRTADSEDEPEKVVKKTKQVSEYFNTLGAADGKNKLISAIIDEEVKAVDGSRVRLRLLDDIEIGDETIRKGTYLYATMSGFGKQRVQGKVESIFYDEDIIKVSLSIYDTDGMQGLYVPLSSFRETTKDIASSAMQGGSMLDNSTTSSSGIRSWASQAAQNATQKVMNAFGTAVKKNKVRLKYGTKVYLVDESQKDKQKRK